LAKEHTDRALRSMEAVGGDNQFLLDLFEYMLCRDY
jgi:hypothetical protein